MPNARSPFRLQHSKNLPAELGHLTLCVRSKINGEKTRGQKLLLPEKITITDD